MKNSNIVNICYQTITTLPTKHCCTILNYHIQHLHMKNKQKKEYYFTLNFNYFNPDFVFFCHFTNE